MTSAALTTDVRARNLLLSIALVYERLAERAETPAAVPTFSTKT
jgi:hypothetical protein